MRVDLGPIAELRRGLEVRPGLADLDALAARGTRVREEADARLFAVSRLLETVSGMPFVNNVISQFSRALSTALASAPQAVPVPSSGPEERERFVVGIDRVRAAHQRGW
ncbi:hypothetical protein BS329_35805 [Amycolatopsis coloradensis]|uniref:Uncharacterized protein n=1 Tax=Amycolatopsis coloradensis TaxID=76021 RepID=A0A1R0KGG6_9PSEU|nr:hypothetical protein [Amycolatopsis coloradensis]OLZ44675.1 hypothetical protein BS329_35805 [Amycolatopsis coloradensis]